MDPLIRVLDGKVLDGWHRYQAALKLKPRAAVDVYALGRRKGRERHCFRRRSEH